MNESLLYRAAVTEANGIDVAAGTARLSFSSEHPVLRRADKKYGTHIEILSHAPGDLNNSILELGAPVLLDHDDGMVIGYVTRGSFQVGTDRRGRANIEVDPEWRSYLKAIPDGEAPNSVSVGYSTLSVVKREEGQNGIPILTFSWLPEEISILTKGNPPADPRVGIGRSLNMKNSLDEILALALSGSRKLYLEFTLAETLEHFLSCHRHAFEYFDGVVRQVWVDNCKVAVLSRAAGAIVFNPRYLDFANHYGFQIRACGVGQPQEKGRVENGVGYVKKNFLNGLELSDFQLVNPAARVWLDTVANVRVHGQTHQTPQELFAREKLKPLHPLPYEAARLDTVRVNSQFRIKVDGNQYSVPCQYASSQLTLKRFPERLLVYDQDKLVAEHVRHYDRHQDYELPDHVAPLLLQRHKAREQKLFLRFLALSPQAHDYYQQLEQRRLNPKHHAQKIVALSELYGVEAVARALEDAFTYQAFSCEYIANLLQQRQHPPQEPGGRL